MKYAGSQNILKLLSPFSKARVMVPLTACLQASPAHFHYNLTFNALPGHETPMIIVPYLSKRVAWPLVSIINTLGLCDCYYRRTD